MKLVYIHQYFKFPSESGGVRSHQLATRFASYGKEVHIVTTSSEKFSGWKIVEKDSITVHYCSLPYDNKMPASKRIIAFLSFVISSSLYSRKLKPTLVYATSTPLTVAIPALFLKIVCKTPYVFEVRDVWPEAPIAIGALKNGILKKIAFLLEKLAYKQASLILALSPDMAKSIIDRYPSVCCEIVPNLSSPALFSSTESVNCLVKRELIRIKAKHKHIVFYTGTLGEVNNLSWLVELSKYSDGEIGFVIIGDGKEELLLRNLAQELGVLGSQLYMLPSVKKSDLSFVHECFDIAVSTILPIKELEANSANKIFDAFASGTPILINHGGWIAALIDTHSCGITLRGAASKANYIALRSFLNDKNTFNIAKKNSLALGQKEFNVDVLSTKLNKLLDSLEH